MVLPSMFIPRILSITILSAALAACATGPRPVNPEKSLALNLAEAGGIDGLKDQALTSEDYSRIHSSGADVISDVGWAAANFSAPAPGFSGGWGLGLGLLSMIRDTDTAAKHRQLVAWMPVDMADTPEEARSKLLDLASEAIRKTFDELGWKHGQIERTAATRRGDSYIFVGGFFENEAAGCPGPDSVSKDQCVGGIYVYPPVRSDWSFSASGPTAKPSYFFQVDKIYNNRVVFTNRGHSGANTQLFYMTLSKHLPEWSYFYIPPKQYMKVFPGDNHDFPQLYYQGKMELFVTVKK